MVNNKVSHRIRRDILLCKWTLGDFTILFVSMLLYKIFDLDVKRHLIIVVFWLDLEGFFFHIELGGQSEKNYELLRS